MSLGDLKIPKLTVPVPGGEVAVRGLSLNDIMPIYREHEAVLSDLYNKVTGEGSVLGASDMPTMISGLVVMAPDIAAAIIAVAADEADKVAVAKSLPFPVQLVLLEKVGELTFESISPKNFIETVIRMATGTTRVLSELQA